MYCETYLAVIYAWKPTSPKEIEKSIIIHQPNYDELQFWGNKIVTFLVNFPQKSSKSAGLYNYILYFSKRVGQVGLWAYHKAI